MFEMGCIPDDRPAPLHVEADTGRLYYRELVWVSGRDWSGYEWDKVYVDEQIEMELAS